MPVDEPLYPVNLRLKGERCVVIGGGRVALGKVRGLLEAEAAVTVIAREIAPDIADELGTLDVAIERRAYRTGDLAGFRLAITATGDPDVDGSVFRDGEAAGVWVNSADDPANCRFTLPSRIRRGPLLVTFATGGRSPAIARWLRERYENEFGPEYEVLIDLLAEVREERRARGETTESPGWQRALDSGMLELIREGNLAEAKERLQACLSSSSG
jgi:siroheme synthase-like protein